jgi:ribosomal protein S12 methylthiotransferase accessory factor
MIVGCHLVKEKIFMEMIVDFPGGDRVDAHFGPYTVMTDQPSPSGEAGSAPTPFSLFLASIATCAGIYVLGFCKQRNLPTEGMRIIQRAHRNQTTGMIENIDLEIQTPPGFPEKYLPSLVRSAELCAVKKHLETPPVFKVFTQTISPVEIP